MSTSYESFQKRRLRTSYFSVVISITLVLFMLGTLGLIVLQSSKVAAHFKEEIVVSLFLKDGTTPQDLQNFKYDLAREEYVKSVKFITKEEAIKEIGEEFLEFLGENPLKDLIDLHLKASYVTPEKLAALEAKFNKEAFIYEVSYDKVLVEKLVENINNISFWLLIATSFFAVIAVLLMNSSIRLSIYAKRFNIKTMQMVGATKSFIRRPFIIQSIRLGLIGVIMALTLLGVLVYYVDLYVPTFGLLEDFDLLIYTSIGVFLTAFIICWVSTYFAAQRFLNLTTNELYE